MELFKNMFTFFFVAHLLKGIGSLDQSAAMPSNLSKQKIMELVDHFLAAFLKPSLVITRMGHLADYNRVMERCELQRLKVSLCRNYKNPYV